MSIGPTVDANSSKVVAKALPTLGWAIGATVWHTVVPVPAPGMVAEEYHLAYIAYAAASV